ncbi:MAG: tyrosine-type recombinase/integrase [Faecalibacterium sp.]|nr:tyrosine-type recombinase/integrase [Faecalibacterium sp.]
MAKLKKRSDGRYQRKVTLPSGKKKLVYGRTLAELTAAVDAAREADRGGLQINDRTTVEQWSKIWLTTYKADLRENTKYMYADVVRLHIVPIIGEYRIKEVKPVHAKAVLNAVSTASNSLQHKVLITMRQLFREARRNKLILDDPTDGLKTTPKEAPKKKKHLTPIEIETLMQRTTDPRARVFVGLCLYCGLRREEALGLQWGDIDSGHLTISRAVAFPGGRNQPDTDMRLKTRGSHRTLPIPQPLHEILEQTPQMGLWVVPAADGGVMTLSAFRRLWDNVHMPGLTPHMLRHTYATTLYKAGVDVRTAQKLMGHSSIKMTADIYTHLEQEDLTQAAAGQLDIYFSPEKKKKKATTA